MSPLTRKQMKSPKKTAIIDQILLKGHDVSFEDFINLLNKMIKFKLHLQESVLIKCD